MPEITVIPPTLPAVIQGPYGGDNYNSTTRVIQNGVKVSNVPDTCLKIAHSDNFYDPIGHGRGRKIEVLKPTFNNIKEFKKYVVSIHTCSYTQFGFGSSGIEEIKKAMQHRAISLASGKWVNNGGDNHALQFYLSKKIGDYRVELAHENHLGMNVESLYQWDMRVGYAAASVIFFQTRELDGNMNTIGGGRPVVAIILKNENTVKINIRSDDGVVDSKDIAILDCPQKWYNFKLKIIWHRDNPFIQIAINGKSVFQTNQRFGAYNSRSHYSKFGAYIPQQENIAGVKETTLLFDNVKETHRQFTPHYNVLHQRTSIERVAYVSANSVGITCNTDKDQSDKINEQLALAAKRNKGLYFPPGKYRIDKNINMPSNSSLVGSSNSNSGCTIFYGKSAGRVVEIGETTETLSVSNIVIRDIIFDNVIICFSGRMKSNIEVSYNAFINSCTTPEQAQISLAHASYIVKGNILMRGKEYPGIGINTYKNTNTSICHNYLGSLSNKSSAVNYLDIKTNELIYRLNKAKNKKDIIIDDDQGNYICAWYATDGLSKSKFYRNFIAGNNLQNLYNSVTKNYDVKRDHIIYIKHYDDIDIYQNYFTGWPETAHGQLKFRNAKGLFFVGNYLKKTSFDARPYDTSHSLFMSETYIFNNYIEGGRVTYWQNFDDDNKKKIEVSGFYVFNNKFRSHNKSTASIIATKKNKSNNFFVVPNSNIYIDSKKQVISSGFTDISLDKVKSKIPEVKEDFFYLNYIDPK